MIGKKSFVLYADLKATIDQLPHDKAGELFKLILDYVNDLNPEPKDILLKIAFEPIRQQLKRDLVKWDGFRQKQAQNGAKGGRPPKAKPKKKNPKNPSLFFETQKSLNANGTVNVTVNDNEIQIQPEFFEVFEIWLKYKHERQETYKSDDSKKICFESLLKLSDNKLEIAKLIVKQSMANNWAGLFKLKEIPPSTPYIKKAPSEHDNW